MNSPVCHKVTGYSPGRVESPPVDRQTGSVGQAGAQASLLSAGAGFLGGGAEVDQDDEEAQQKL